jgi:hypothetical protein
VDPLGRQVRAMNATRAKVLPPDGDGDAWVTVFLEGDAVAANSWSCWRVLYDMTTGTETARHFTK